MMHLGENVSAAGLSSKVLLAATMPQYASHPFTGEMYKSVRW